MKRKLLNFQSVLLLLLGLLSYSLSAQQTITVGTGTYAQYMSPNRFYYPYGWTANVYSKAEIGSGYTINSLAYNVYSTGGYTYSCSNQKVYMAEVSDSVFNSTSYISPSSVNAVLVYDGNVTFNSSGWKTITLQSSFTYQGTGHLLILWENRKGTTTSGSSSYPRFYSNNPSGNRSMQYISSSSSNIFNSSTSGYTNSYRPNIQLGVSSLSSNDLALTNWFYPTQGYTGGSNTPIMVTVKNVGTAAQSGFSIKYSIDNGATWVSGTHANSLAAGSSTNYFFSTTADMSAMGLYKMIAVVSNTGDTITYNDTIRQDLIICGSGMSGTYTVGGSNPDFVSISDAVNFLKTCGVSAACTFNIAAGTYNEKIRIPAITGVSATNTVTFQAASQGVVKIKSSATTAADNYVVSLDTAQYITLKNLTIESNSPVYSTALRLYNSKNIHVEGNHIESKNTTYNNTNNSTVYLYNSSTAYGKDITLKNNTIESGAYGLYLVAGSSYRVHNLLIEGNDFNSYFSQGIFANQVDSMQIEKNTFTTTSSSVALGVQVGSSVNFFSFRKNKIHHSNGGDGFYLNNGVGTSSENMWINNNFVYLNTNNGDPGISLYNPYYANIDYNSVLIEGYNTYSSGITINNGGSGQNKLRNNNVINRAGGYALYVNNYSSLATSDYNNFYTNGSYLAYWGYNRNNLAALQSASSKDANSLSSNVTFYGNGDLHTNSSSLNASGTPITGITTDIDGNTRHSSTPDIGADEFIIAQNDAGLVNFLTVNRPCSGTSFPVKVNMKNFGSQNMFAATINWSVNGVVQTTKSFTGALTSGSNTNVTLGNFTFLADSTYTLKAWISGVNNTTDGNSFNDTVEYSGYKTAMGNGTYVIGSGSGTDYSDIGSAISDLQTNGICGPVVLALQNGTYTGNFEFTNISGTNATNTITLTSVSGNANDVILENNTQTSSLNYYVARFDGAQYMKMKHLTFKSTTGSYNRLIEVLSASAHIEFDSCRFIGRSITSTSTNYSLFTVIQADHIMVSNSYFQNGSYAIVANGNSAAISSDIRVKNNEFEDAFFASTYVSYYDSVYVENNSVNTQTTYSGAMGIGLYRLPDDVVVRGNQVKMQNSYTSYGVYADDLNMSNVSTNNIHIYNNMINLIATSSSYAQYGIYMDNNYRAKVHFNTVKVESNNSGSCGFYVYYGNYNNVRNNSFEVDYGYPIYIYSSSNLVSDYNNLKGDYYVGRYGSYTRNTLALWQSYTNLDAHSKSVTPNYVASDDLHMFDFNLNGAGTSITGITTDIDGETRATNPDIGADEFMIVSRDAAMVAIELPNDTTPIGNSAIKVRIKNMGTQNLVLTMINWSVDGNVGTPYAWVGALQTLQEDSMISIGTYNFTAGAHNIKVWVTNPNNLPDMNTLNDTIEKAVFSKQIPVIEFNPNPLTATLTSCNDSTQVNLDVINAGGATLNYGFTMPGASYDSTSTQYYYSTGANTLHYFSNLSSNFDTLYFEITINGDYDSSSEYVTISADGVNVGTFQGGSTYQDLTTVMYLTGSSLASIIQDGSVTVTVDNSYQVNTGYGTNMNKVHLYANGANWISTSAATSGTVNANDTSVVSFKFKSTGLQNGVYTESITFTSNDPANTSVQLPVTFTVNGSPILTPASTTLSMGSTFIGVPVIDSVLVSNTGCGDLYVSNVTTSNTMFVSQTSLDTLPVGMSKYYFFTYTPTTAGAHSATATIISNAGNTTLNLNGTGVTPPILTATPNPIIANIVNCGDSVTIPLKLENTGAGILTTNLNATNTGDSVNILILTYNQYSSSATANLINMLKYYYPKVNTLSYYSSNATSIQTQITSFNPDLIVFPYSSYTNNSYYSSMSSMLQTFVTNGGYVMFAGSPNNAPIQTGLFTGSYSGWNDYSNFYFSVTDSLLNDLTSPAYAGTEDFYYYNFTNTDVVSLFTYSTNYDVFAYRQIGSGKAIYMGYEFYYNSTVQRRVASNITEEVAENKQPDWIDYSSSVQNISASNFVYENIKFKSANLAAGQYITDLKVHTNNPANPTTIIPCTLNVQNLIANGVNLGPDTTTCGIISLDAGSGYTSYVWSTGATTQTIPATSSGTYSVTASNGTLCQSVDTVVVTIQALPSVAIANFTNQMCEDGSPITLVGIPAGGVFTGSGIVGNTFDPSLANIGSNTITYTYTNASGCSNSAIAYATVKALPTVQISGLSATYCPEDAAVTLTLSPSGGSLSGNGVAGSTFDPSFAGAGNHELIYTATVNGCSNSDTANTQVFAATPVSITGLQSDYCINDTIAMLTGNPTGGTFSGNGITGATFNPATAGVGSHTITYTIVDGNSCTNSESLVTTVNSIPTVSISGPTGDLCANGADEALTLVPATGGTLTGAGIVGGMFSPSLAGAGAHSIIHTYTTAAGCVNSDTAVINVVNPATISFTALNADYCLNDAPVSLQATPANGVFSINGNVVTQIDPATLGVGSFYIKYEVTDGNNCTSVDSTMVSISDLPTVSFSGLNTTYCSNGTASTLTGIPAGGVFSGAGMNVNTFDPVLATPGYHAIVYTYSNPAGCSNTDTHYVQVYAAPIVDAGADTTIDNNTSATMNASVTAGSGNFGYQWMPGNLFANPNMLNPFTNNLTSATNFTLTVTDLTYGCTASDQMTVYVQGGNLAADLLAIPGTICEGDSSVLQVLPTGGSGNYTYTWSSQPAGTTGTSNILTVTPNVTTTYTCVTSDGSNTVSNNIVVTVNNVPAIQISNLANHYCSNDSTVVLNISPAGGMLSGSGITGMTFDPSAASIGTFNVVYTYTTAQNCTTEDVVQVTVDKAPTAYAGADTTMPCANGGVVLGQQPYSGVTYLWTPSMHLNDSTLANPMATPNLSLTYTLIATDTANGCSATDDVSITISDAPNATSSSDTTICKGGQAELWVSGGDMYLWNTGSTDSTIIVSPTSTRVYQVIASLNGCADAEYITVFVNDPQVDLGIDTTICNDESYMLDAGIWSSYLWSTGETSAAILVDSTGHGMGTHSIWVQVEDTLGCFGYDTAVVEIELCIGIENAEQNFQLSVYPNPSNGMVTVASEDMPLGVTNLRVMNAKGQIIAQERVSVMSPAFRHKMDLSHLAKGVYLIHISGERYNDYVRIVIQ